MKAGNSEKYDALKSDGFGCVQVETALSRGLQFLTFCRTCLSKHTLHLPPNYDGHLQDDNIQA